MDDRYEDMQQSNARMLHLILTPLRILVGVGKGILLLLVIMLTFTYNQLGWIVGLGHMGWLSRHATADIMLGIPHPMSSSIPPEHSEIFTIDLSARQHRWAYRYGPGEVSGVAIDPLPYVLPGRLQPPDYCFERVSRDDPGQGMEGWFNRTRTVYERKGSRMFEAYVTGTISVAYLRTTLARIKMGMAPDPNGDDCEMDPNDSLALSAEELRSSPGGNRFPRRSRFRHQVAHEGDLHEWYS